MNTQTRDAMIQFINKVSEMAVGCIHQLGSAQVSEIVFAAQQLEDALKEDETIKD